MADCKEFGISWKWYAAILALENGFKSFGTDGKGSYGISQMQVLTAKITARKLGDDPTIITPRWMETHPLAMIRYGASCFHDLIYEFRGVNRYYWGTRAYNAGATRIILARRGFKRWKYLSEKYYWDVYKRYGDLSKCLDDSGK